MAEVRLLTVEQKSPSWVQDACSDYLPRFRHHFRLKIEEIPLSRRGGMDAQIEYTRKLLNRIRPNDFLVLLDERGLAYTTLELANKLTQWELIDRSLVFAIGGADGWCSDARNRADSLWSLSKLVFPNQLARVIVVEQLYRADSVRQGHPYHRS